MDSTDKHICMSAWEGDGHGAVTPPVFQTSIFTKPTFEAFVREQEREHERYVYSRGANPTVAFLERRLALLERGEACKCFASGMGAVSAVLMSLLRRGDHVLFVNSVYGPTLELAEHLRRFGIDHSVAPDADIEPHLRENTALVYVESPGTMRMKVLDLSEITRVARSRGVWTVMDNTWSTPLFQKPILHGVDVVIHSCTKYIGGHSDVLGGAVIGPASFIRDLFYTGYQLFGSVMSAMEASMVLRGLRTLPVRMAEHERNAKRVVDYLLTRPEVAAVHHPHAAHHPDEPIIKNQFSGFSGLLSFDLEDGSFERVARFVDRLSLFRIGVSWGGYESLVTAPVRPGTEEAMREQGLSPGTIRLSVGLEGAESQIEDLARAFGGL